MVDKNFEWINSLQNKMALFEVYTENGEDFVRVQLCYANEEMNEGEIVDVRDFAADEGGFASALDYIDLQHQTSYSKGFQFTSEDSNKMIAKCKKMNACFSFAITGGHIYCLLNIDDANYGEEPLGVGTSISSFSPNGNIDYSKTFDEELDEIVLSVFEPFLEYADIRNGMKGIFPTPPGQPDLPDGFQKLVDDPEEEEKYRKAVEKEYGEAPVLEIYGSRENIEELITTLTTVVAGAKTKTRLEIKANLTEEEYNWVMKTVIERVNAINQTQTGSGTPQKISEFDEDEFINLYPDIYQNYISEKEDEDKDKDEDDKPFPPISIIPGLN